jgi:hypothetical protein
LSATLYDSCPKEAAVQRRAQSFRVSMALLAATATLVAGATLAGAAARAPRAKSATVQVLDVGLVRLHVPATWVLDVGQKICAHGACRRQCAPGYDKRVYLSTFPPVVNCLLNFRRNSVWIVPTSRIGATTRQTLSYDGGTVILSIPSSGVTLYGFGKPGERAVLTETPSTLARLLGSVLPAAVPHSWQRVTDGALSMAVPSSWPVRRLGTGAVGPGACGAQAFPRPEAVLGVATAVVHCPAFIAASLAAAGTTPGNGAWLFDDTGSRSTGGMPLVAFDPPGLRAQTLAVHGLTVTVRFPLAPNGTNTVWVSVNAGGHHHVLVLGLGASPNIAAAILSSLRAD